jgi:hypothetical protein
MAASVRALTTPDIGYGAEGREVVSRHDGRVVLVGLPAHPAVERSPELRVLGQVLIGRHTVREHEAGLAGHDRLAQSAPGLPGLRGAHVEGPIADGVRPVAAQGLTERGEGKAPVGLLAEHPHAGEHAQQSVQRRPVRVRGGG